MKNVLVAYDGGQAAHRALKTGIELARCFDASLGVVSVIPVHPGRVPVDPWDATELHDTHLSEACKILSQHGVIAQLFKPAGDPADTIPLVAETGHFDTIIIGTGGSGALARFLRSSVSERLATDANATVVVTH